MPEQATLQTSPPDFVAMTKASRLSWELGSVLGDMAMDGLGWVAPPLKAALPGRRWFLDRRRVCLPRWWVLRLCSQRPSPSQTLTKQTEVLFCCQLATRNRKRGATVFEENTLVQRPEPTTNWWTLLATEAVIILCCQVVFNI